MNAGSPRSRAPRPWIAPFAAFAGFGTLWGGWGAALPALRAQAGVSDGELGVALLFVSVGALPVMPVTGRLVDRFGLRLAAPLLALLGLAGLLVAAIAVTFVALAAAAVLLGAASGAADVAINTLAGRAEQQAARPLLARSHGVFSVAVVVSSLSAGSLLSTGLDLAAVFLSVAVVVLVLAGAVWLARPATREGRRRDAGGVEAVPPVTAAGDPSRSTPARAIPLVVGVVGAAAYAVENAHQSWGAVFLTEVLAANPQQAGLAAATFAAAAAVTRLLLAPLSRSCPLATLLLGGLVAAAGTLLVAAAPSIAVALAGLAVAAAGVALLFPTLLSRTVRDLGPHERGRVTSTISTTAYLGYLVGPALVGLLTEATDLRTALIGVAALALVFSAVVAPTTRWAGRRSGAAGRVIGLTAEAGSRGS